MPTAPPAPSTLQTGHLPLKPQRPSEAGTMITTGSGLRMPGSERWSDVPAATPQGALWQGSGSRCSRQEGWCSRPSSAPALAAGGLLASLPAGESRGDPLQAPTYWASLVTSLSPTTRPAAPNETSLPTRRRLEARHRAYSACASQQFYPGHLSSDPRPTGVPGLGAQPVRETAGHLLFPPL